MLFAFQDHIPTNISVTLGSSLYEALAAVTWLTGPLLRFKNLRHMQSVRAVRFTLHLRVSCLCLASSIGGARVFPSIFGAKYFRPVNMTLF